MPTALTRAVSRSLASCELTWLSRQEIDIDLAIEQHRQYERSLTAMGVCVISLPEQPEMPDAVFVEDPLVVVDEVDDAEQRIHAFLRQNYGPSLLADAW